MKKPLHFSITAVDDPALQSAEEAAEDSPDRDGRPTDWLAVDPSSSSAWKQGPEIRCSIPPEFGGPGNGWSPEDFLGMTLANCFIATTRVYAKLSRLKYDSLTVKVDTTIGWQDKLPKLESANFTVTMVGVAETNRAKRVLERISKSCIMINALDCQKDFNIVVD